MICVHRLTIWNQICCFILSLIFLFYWLSFLRMEAILGRFELSNWTGSLKYTRYLWRWKTGFDLRPLNRFDHFVSPSLIYGSGVLWLWTDVEIIPKNRQGAWSSWTNQLHCVSIRPESFQQPSNPEGRYQGSARIWTNPEESLRRNPLPYRTTMGSSRWSDLISICNRRWYEANDWTFEPERMLKSLKQPMHTTRMVSIERNQASLFN